MSERAHTKGREDGGPAFPTPCDGFGGMTYGMSLRDWFAGQALGGIMSNQILSGQTFESDARMAYDVADAMLKARAASPSGDPSHG